MRKDYKLRRYLLNLIKQIMIEEHKRQGEH